MLKWIRVFKAVRALMHVVADADEDQKISAEEQRDILKAMWSVVRAYRGEKPKNEPTQNPGPPAPLNPRPDPGVSRFP